VTTGAWPPPDGPGLAGKYMHPEKTNNSEARKNHIFTCMPPLIDNLELQAPDIFNYRYSGI
jgi:hypothetical protein